MSEGKYLAYMAKVVKVIPLKKVKHLECVVLDNKCGCVVRKDDGWEVGDEGVYMAPGAIVPRTPEYEYMRKFNYKVEKRLICGHWSNGMFLSKECLKEYVGDKMNLTNTFSLPRPAITYTYMKSPLYKSRSTSALDVWVSSGRKTLSTEIGELYVSSITNGPSGTIELTTVRP